MDPWADWPLYDDYCRTYFDKRDRMRYGELARWTCLNRGMDSRDWW